MAETPDARKTWRDALKAWMTAHPHPAGRGHVGIGDFERRQIRRLNRTPNPALLEWRTKFEAWRTANPRPGHTPGTNRPAGHRDTMEGMVARNAEIMRLYHLVNDPGRNLVNDPGRQPPPGVGQETIPGLAEAMRARGLSGKRNQAF